MKGEFTLNFPASRRRDCPEQSVTIDLTQFSPETIRYLVQRGLSGYIGDAISNGMTIEQAIERVKTRKPI